MQQKTLILGSTGNVGRRLVETLAAAGEEVVAATRRPEAEARPGVRQVRLDAADGESIEAALEGVDRVFVMSPPGVLAADEYLGLLLDKALARVRKVVVQTADGVQYDEGQPLRKVERRVEESGKAFVFLRPNWFMDNFHTFWAGPIEAAGLIRVPAGEARSAFVDAGDIAAAAAVALRSGAFDGQAFSLTGPEALSYGEAAAVLSRHAGKEIRYAEVGDEEFLGMMTQAGLAEDYARHLVRLFGFVRQGAASQVTDAVEKLTGRKPGRLEEYAARQFGR